MQTETNARWRTAGGEKTFVNQQLIAGQPMLNNI